MVGRCSPREGPRFRRPAFSGFDVPATGPRAASVPLITRRNTGFFARYRRSPNILGGFFGIVGSLHRVCATVKDRADQGSLPVRRRMVAPAFLAYLLTRQAA